MANMGAMFKPEAVGIRLEPTDRDHVQVRSGVRTFPMPTHNVGDAVKIRPLEDMEGRVMCVYWDRDGLTYDARYFQNGEAKTCRLFPDEIEAA